MAERVYTETIEVAASPERVHEVLVDVERWPTWTSSMAEVRLRGPGPLREGSEVEVKQPRLPAGRWRVDRVDAGNGFAWSTSSGGVRSWADHRIRPTPTGCQVILELRQSGPLAGVAGVLLGGLVRRYVRMEAEGLKARAEAPPGGQAGGEAGGEAAPPP